VFALLLTACAATPELSEREPLAPQLSQYRAVYAVIDGASDVRAKDSYSPTSERLLGEFVADLRAIGKTASFGRAPQGQHALEAQLMVTDFNYVDGAARIFGGILAGRATLGVTMTLSDPANGAVLGVVSASDSSSQLHGVFGADTDRQVHAMARELAVKLQGLGEGGSAGTFAAYAPSTVPPPTAKPLAGGSAEADRLPPRGSRWSYVMKEGLSSGQESRFSVVLANVDGPIVTETFSGSSGSASYGSDVRQIGFHVRRLDSDRVLELAPYLLARIAAPSFPLQDAAYLGAAQDWQARVTGVQRETIVVPAGRFDSYRVEVAGENNKPPVGKGRNHMRNFVYEVWYAPQAGRYVQAHYKTFNNFGSALADAWVQLETFNPGREAAPSVNGQ
jgi:hypothetical protein